MNTIIHHRGPDDEGYVLFSEEKNKSPVILGGQDTSAEVIQSEISYCPKISRIADSDQNLFVALGHRRLSIVDLSPAGHQPMSYRNGDYWIVYNGEIYNWKELRQELEAQGYVFLSHTDTEIILAAYAHWGKECLDHFNGMWAFVIFDAKKQTIFAARDRFGIKPLYYWYSAEGFLAFASEIKQFTVLPGWNPGLNEARAHDFLVNALIDHTDETLFKDVHQIRGGYAVEFSPRDCSGMLPVYRWYELHPDRSPASLDSSAAALKEVLKESVNLQLRADVPVGTCLSGGLDSSSIVCLVNDILQNEKIPAPQKTFSAGSEIRQFDEREFCDEVVKDRQIEAHFVYPSFDGLFPMLDTIIWHQDEPFISTSMYAQWLVFSLAAENNVKVILDGQGADEQLCGYHNFFLYRFMDLIAQFRFLALIQEMLAVHKRFNYPVSTAVLGVGYLCLPAPLRTIFRNIFRKQKTHPDWISIPAPENNFDLFPILQKNESAVERYSLLQILQTSLPSLLHWEDRDSMAHSIESRVPFLDHRLVELAVGLPSDLKIKGDTTKIVFREAMTGIIPEKVRTRKDKIGFATAEEEWIRLHPEEFRDEIHKAIAASAGILNDRAVEKFELFISGKQPFSFEFWRWICFGRWMKTFEITH